MCIPLFLHIRQPPCEAVSWNTANIRILTSFESSASLWGCELKCVKKQKYLLEIWVSLLVRLWVEIDNVINNFLPSTCQPPCEAVSWNTFVSSKATALKSSASLWGCELKCYACKSKAKRITSASLWGCELKYDEQIKAHMISFVSLLVRLWVEILR